MGETGPCGPCSEIHIDRGGPGSDPRDGANREIGVNAGNERFIEIWNLVFIQFNRRGRRQAAPSCRRSTSTPAWASSACCRVLQGKSLELRHGRLHADLRAASQELTGQKYDGRRRRSADVAFRVIADHVPRGHVRDRRRRAAVQRGPRLRAAAPPAARVALRRASTSGSREPFLCDVVPAVVRGARRRVPRDDGARASTSSSLIRAEEESFGRTLDRGLVLFDKLAPKLGKSASQTIPGAEAFELYDTYGFPLDLVELMARERGLTVDRAGWEAAQKKHQAASKVEGRFKQVLSAENAGQRQADALHVPRGRLRRARAATRRVLVASGAAENEVAVVLDREPVLRRGRRPGRRHGLDPRRGRASCSTCATRAAWAR